MKPFLITLLLLISLPAFSPGERLIVFATAPVCPYERLAMAVCMVESSGGKFLVNKKESAFGAFQVRKIRLIDYNQRTGNNYTISDLMNYEISKRIFLFYCHGNDYEHICKSWNGSGKKNEQYWKRVQKELSKI